MKASIRKAVDGDRAAFIEFALQLSRFNRSNHDERCKYDDYTLVVEAIQKKAGETFDGRDENTLILMAEVSGEPVGYALGRIFMAEPTADNGTGRMGLFDELFLDDRARGMGLGQMLMDETLAWMKQQGISRVKLHAYSWNVHAKKIYERNGFREYAVSYEAFI